MGASVSRKAQDEGTLETLYATHQPLIYAFCFRLLNNEDDAQDAMQSAFIAAFRSISRFRGDSSVKTWLYRIATNESLDVLRKRKVAAGRLDVQTECADQTNEVTNRITVDAVLRRVGAQHRVLLILRYWEELSYEEIAGVVGLPLSTVKMRLHRAREEFKIRYDESA